ncbi:DedA family protein [Actibacterium pelagium]|uniref:DedA family protein n=1 Tax=Actibacterium pelagium TaxID=2029103 RepID=UPI001177BBB2|nr:DedA family protein [Actibacterium pelagium]
MTDSLLSLVSVYGVWVLGISIFLSCMAVPLPTSLLLLVTGGFIAGGEVTLTQALLVGSIGAISGDQAAYLVGRYGGKLLLDRFARAPHRRKLVDKASNLLHKRGFLTVFFTRWLVAPLGPYVNLAGGASGLSHRQFSLGSISGELVWVFGYIGIGYAFSSSISLVSDILSNATGLLAAACVVVGLLFWLRAALHQRPDAKS